MNKLILRLNDYLQQRSVYDYDLRQVFYQILELFDDIDMELDHLRKENTNLKERINELQRNQNFVSRNIL